MSDFESADGAPHTEPPSKRRRVHDDSTDTTPRFETPDDGDGNDEQPGAAEAKELPSRSLSIRRGRPPSRPSSRNSNVNSDSVADRYHSTSSGSHPSRSRSRSRRRTRSYSQSRSHSRSRSRTDSDRSKSRSQSRSRRSHSATSSASQRRSQSRTPQPTTPPAQAPLRPAYRRRLELRGHSAAVSQVRISPDGRWIASASADGTAKVWDAATGAHMDTFVGHMAGVSCIAWAPDGDMLATGSDDKAIRLWDRVTASPAHASGEVARRGDDDRAVRGRTQGQARARVAATRGGRTGRGPLLGHHNYVYCVAFSPKGNILASGSYDEAVFLWDVRAGRLMRSLPAHSDPVSGIDFCRDGTLVVSCSTDGLM